jgi:serine protease Do
VLGQFEKYGKVKRPYLGVVFVEGVAARYGLPSNEGLTITDIVKNSPAEKYGLEINDVLMEVNGAEVTTIIDYNEELKKYLPGSSATLTVRRNGREISLKAVFGEKEQ